MRVGLVSKWFASGQAVVTRQLRSALDSLGHETFVLARPGKGPREQVDRGDPVWAQPGVTQASGPDVPADEYADWAQANGLEAVVCDNNYQFEELARLRGLGVRTLGRFVWEHFAPEHVAGAREAYEIVYSFTRAEQERYATLGIESPYVPWGCHPELSQYLPAAASQGAAATGDPGEAGIRPGAAGSDEGRALVRYYVPGSFMGKRKPFGAIVEAFARVPDQRLRLLVRGQVERKRSPVAEAARVDPRIEVELSDRPTAEHLRQFASCDVCLSPSRWEGLGLPLYEAIAFGMPTITNDAPPMNEAVRDGVNGVLVASVPWGEARSGIAAFDPDVEELATAIERLADGGERERLAAGARELRDTERSWKRTTEGLGELLDRVSAG